MRAAVYTGNSKLEVRDVPTPEVGPNEVLVEVSCCAICGTDVHAVMYDVAPPGTVLGHEYSGKVVEVGGDITRWTVGDRVVGGGGNPPPGRERDGTSIPATTTVARLRPGQDTRLCRVRPHGGMGADSHSGRRILRVRRVMRARRGGRHAVRLSQLRLGDTVAVIGAGPIGLFTIQAARAAGATSILVSEPSATRRAAAEALDADRVIDPTQEDPVKASEEMTGGAGVHVVFDCAGIKGTLDQAANMVRPRGQVVLIAVPWEPHPSNRRTGWHATSTSKLSLATTLTIGTPSSNSCRPARSSSSRCSESRISSRWKTSNRPSSRSTPPAISFSWSLGPETSPQL